jgi:L-seryl-tRNA(Ser) seleniumtransferase
MRPPSVDTLAKALSADHPSLPHALLVQAARAGIAAAMDLRAPERCTDEAAIAARRIERSLLQPVINATGTLLHTNLGRAPRLSAAGMDDTLPIRYSSLEFDLETGRRGSRRNHAATLLATLGGAESALVVNNCAAALMLTIAALGHNRGVAVSRSEMVEIGGAFRIPDVLASQGAKLVEVGTTNRTRAADFERAAGRRSSDVGMILSVHRSNYRITGFTEEPALAELAAVAKARRIPLVLDIGSGLLDARMPWLADPSGKVPSLPWLANEPAVRQTLAAGADIVVFSGDKLLGGPQAGVIAGRKELVDRCASHPLARALRPGGSVLAELQDVCHHYLNGAARNIPFWEMATRDVDQLHQRAEQIEQRVGSPSITARACFSVPGGGTLPDAEIPSYGLHIAGDNARELRASRPPIIARSSESTTIIDLRTVDPLDDDVLVNVLRTARLRHA